MSVQAKVYVERTLVTYLTAPKTRDPIAVAHPAVTRRWWRRRRRFDLYCADKSLDEIDAEVQRVQRLHRGHR